MFDWANDKLAGWVNEGEGLADRAPVGAVFSVMNWVKTKTDAVPVAEAEAEMAGLETEGEALALKEKLEEALAEVGAEDDAEDDAAEEAVPAARRALAITGSTFVLLFGTPS